MRWAVLLMFGAFGALLILLGWNKYSEVNAGLGELYVAHGTVASHNSTGALVIRYQVNNAPYEAVITPPVLARFPIGSPVQLLFHPDDPGRPQLNHWAALFTDSIVLAGFGALGIFLAVGGFVALGNMLRMPVGARPVTVTAPRSQDLQQMELHHPRGEFYFFLAVAVGAVAVVVVLLRDPDLVWTRWISYLIAFSAALVAPIAVYTAFSNRRERIRADRDGLEIGSGSDCRRVTWTEIGSLKKQTVTRQDDGSEREIATYLVLLDRQGKSICKLDYALEPAADLNRLVEYIPLRTQLPVKEERGSEIDLFLKS